MTKRKILCNSKFKPAEYRLFNTINFNKIILRLLTKLDIIYLIVTKKDTFMALIKELRLASKMSQSEFAKTFNIPLSTLRKWEQFVSTPPKYVINLIEVSIPAYNKHLEVIKADNNKKFYIDTKNKKVFDEKGNAITFTESLDGVIKKNLPIYIDDMFNDFYRLQDRFDRDLKYDKKDQIHWR